MGYRRVRSYPRSRVQVCLPRLFTTAASFYTILQCVFPSFAILHVNAELGNSWVYGLFPVRKHSALFQYIRSLVKAGELRLIVVKGVQRGGLLFSSSEACQMMGNLESGNSSRALISSSR